MPSTTTAGLLLEAVAACSREFIAPLPSGAGFLKVPKKLFGHKERQPLTHNCHPELHNGGGSKPFSKKAVRPKL